MDKKGIAVSQIVLLVLGILVLAVVAYLLYTNFLTSSGAFNAEKCRAEEIRQCTAAKIIPGGIDSDGKTTSKYKTTSCGKTGTEATGGYIIDCKALGITP